MYDFGGRVHGAFSMTGRVLKAPWGSPKCYGTNVVELKDEGNSKQWTGISKV